MSGEEIRGELKALRKKSGEVMCDKVAMARKYEEKIALLPSFEAKVMTLYFIKGKTYEEIAIEIFYSKDTVRRIIKRGIAMLAGG